jgi:hypothetical protein
MYIHNKHTFMQSSDIYKPIHRVHLFRTTAQELPTSYEVCEDGLTEEVSAEYLCVCVCPLLTRFKVAIEK